MLACFKKIATIFLSYSKIVSVYQKDCNNLFQSYSKIASVFQKDCNNLFESYSWDPWPPYQTCNPTVPGNWNQSTVPGKLKSATVPGNWNQSTVPKLYCLNLLSQVNWKYRYCPSDLWLLGWESNMTFNFPCPKEFTIDNNFTKGHF